MALSAPSLNICQAAKAPANTVINKPIPLADIANLNIFKACDRKEKDGTKIGYDIKKAIPALKQMMDSYTDYELAISKSFKDLIDKGE